MDIKTIDFHTGKEVTLSSEANDLSFLTAFDNVQISERR